jgi:hypothetical protein
MSGNDGQYGAGTSTSSPSSRVAAKALKITCLAPLDDDDARQRIVQRFSRWYLALMASRSFSAVPASACTWSRQRAMAAYGGLLDVLRGVEIRLAGGQHEHVATLGDAARRPGDLAAALADSETRCTRWTERTLMDVLAMFRQAPGLCRD